MLRTLRINRLVDLFTENFGLTRTAALTVVTLIAAILFTAVYFIAHTAPPNTLVIASGPVGSTFWTNAYKYKALLATNGVKVVVLTTHGSEENLEMLKRKGARVNVGFVQGGVSVPEKAGERPVVSLGSMFYEPLFLFYRASLSPALLSDFAGKRLGVGAPGSGSRALALTLLATNGIVPGGATTLLDIEGEDGVTNLLAGNADAVFLTSDSISSQTLRKLIKDPSVKLFDFLQAVAYTRRFTFLNKLVIPEGAIDFGKNIPAHDVHLIGPTVELIAAKGLHPALSDLLLDAASRIHGKASLLQQRGEFPAPLASDYPISEDAKRYYKTGKSWLYRNLPFALAGMVAPIATAGVSVALVLIPGLKLIPAILRWRVKLLLFRWYRALLAVERGLQGELTPAKRTELLHRLDHIEATVQKMKVPASFADAFYGLRGHIIFVRTVLDELGSKQG